MGRNMRKTVYVFFGEAIHKKWWTRLLNKNFTHCFSYEHHLLGGYDCFLKIENLYHCFDTKIFFGKKQNLLKLFPQHKIVTITVEVNPVNKTYEFLPLNCVNLIKKQLGLNKPFIIKPEQLYNHLLTIGGKEL